MKVGTVFTSLTRCLAAEDPSWCCSGGWRLVLLYGRRWNSVFPPTRSGTGPGQSPHREKTCLKTRPWLLPNNAHHQGR